MAAAEEATRGAQQATARAEGEAERCQALLRHAEVTALGLGLGLGSGSGLGLGLGVGVGVGLGLDALV